MSRGLIRPRAVFDCNALLQAAISPTGPASKALRLTERGTFDLYLSLPVLKELRAVMSYAKIRQRNPDLTDSDVETFLAQLQFRGMILRKVPHLFDYDRAVQDEPYLDLAAAAKADYLVSRDKDLLSLMTDHSPFCKRFRQKTRPLRVVDPVEFLDAIG